MSGTVLTNVDGHVATVTIDREAALNAISREVMADLAAAIADVEANPDVRVGVLGGAGDRAFVAGADIAVMATMNAQEAVAFAESGGAVASALERSRVPWIARVQGYALGGGCEIALACDVIYASTGAVFGQPEVTLGITPGFGGSQRLPRRVGVAKAKELLLGGAMVPADEALRIRLCDRVVEPDRLDAAIRELADRIAANGPLAVAATKRLVHEGQSMSLEDAVVFEQRLFGEMFTTEDQREGMAAFLEKPRRRPVFRGR